MSECGTSTKNQWRRVRPVTACHAAPDAALRQSVRMNPGSSQLIADFFNYVSLPFWGRRIPSPQVRVNTRQDVVQSRSHSVQNQTSTVNDAVTTSKLSSQWIHCLAHIQLHKFIRCLYDARNIL